MPLQVYVPKPKRPPVKPAVVVSPNRGSMSLNKEAVVLLDGATAVMLLVDREHRVFGFAPCTDDHSAAFKVVVGKSGRGSVRRGGEYVAAVNMAAGRYEVAANTEPGKATKYLGQYDEQPAEADRG